MAKLDSLAQLFEDELRDVYDAERQILKALPRMVKKANDAALKDGLQRHLEETQGQVERLEGVFEACELKVKGKHCAGMAGILEEGKDLMEEDGDPSVLDAGYIAAAQRVEHYEITAYGSLIAWAQSLGYTEAASLLKQNLGEEKAADETLSKLAEGAVNRRAASARAEQPKTRAAGRR